MFNKVIFGSLATLGAVIGAFALSKSAEADCTHWHPHHCGVEDVKREGQRTAEDIQREIDNCFNGGGCDIPGLPADELWGEAGRQFIDEAAAAIAAKNAALPVEPLNDLQKRHLRPHFGDLVDRVRVKYGATLLDNWRTPLGTISEPSGGQTFCNDIYITQRFRPNDADLMELIAHEMVHSQQCERLGGLANFGYEYFKGYKNANQSYRNNPMEEEAYQFDASIDWAKEPSFGRPTAQGDNRGDRITSHIEMGEGDYLLSGDGRWRAVMQGDGNFVIYGPEGPIWATNTNGSGTYPYTLALQSDGNLVVYGDGLNPTWASNTNGLGVGPYTLVMQNDANLVLYDDGRPGTPLWVSDTCCR